MSGHIFMLWVESIAICCWGLTGGVCAVRKGYDLFAILVTGWLTALGGGTIRDIMLGDLPPVGITDKRLVACAIISSLAVAIVHPAVERHRHSFIFIDALALGLFVINGTQKALEHGTSGVTAVFLGMLTGLAGGIIRDMLLNEVPTVVQDKHWYAFPALVGCLLTVLVQRLNMHGLLGGNETLICYVFIVIIVVIMRESSVYFNLYLPGAMTRRNHLVLSVLQWQQAFAKKHGQGLAHQHLLEQSVTEQRLSEQRLSEQTAVEQSLAEQNLSEGDVTEHKSVE